MTRKDSVISTQIRALRPPLNFLTLHYTYFIALPLFSSILLWTSSTSPTAPISYVDSLFMAVSAMTETGLTTVNLSTLNTFQQGLLFLLIIIGSSIFVSWIVVIGRRQVWESRLKEKGTARYAVGEELGDRSRQSSVEKGSVPVHNMSSMQRSFSESGLTKNERCQLGGIEYRAICMFSWMVPMYFVIWQLLGCLTVSLYIGHRKREVARANGVSSWWLGIFVVVSAFNNCGLSLLDQNMIPLGGNVFLLIAFLFLMLAGNTAYPLFLRLSIWLTLKLIPNNSSSNKLRETLRFILNHPRSIYTHLFPSHHTLWLLITLLALTAIDWVAFEALDIKNTILTSISLPARAADGLFQSIANRSAGFDVISISELAIGFQVLCVVMMYISIYPITITLRSSNIYESRSLGLFPSYASPPTTNSGPSRLSFIQQQLRIQLAHDLWWITLSTFLIVCIESPGFASDPVTFSIFNVMFEVVSAYGPVGLSTGLPGGRTESFSGGWRRASKLILCAVMIRGRHRGLPATIDRAVLLPGEENESEEITEGSIEGSIEG